MKYYRTRFAIEAGYVLGEGMNPDKMAIFNNEICNLFKAKGWRIVPASTRNSGPTVKKEKSSLYVHPTELIGTLNEDLVLEVSEIVASCKHCELVKVQKFEEIFDLTEEEALERLKSKESSIIEDIQKMTSGVAPKYTNSVVSKIIGKHRVFRINSSVFSVDLTVPEEQYIKGLIACWVADGQLK